MGMTPNRICIVAPAAWPVISGSSEIKTVGGAEAQQCDLARTLAGAGYQVSMICMDYGQPDAVEIAGVRVFKMHAPHSGLPVVRFIHPRFTSLWAAMRRADADIYYQRCSGVHTGYTAAFCRVHDRKFIFSAAHDADFEADLPLVHYRRDKAIYMWGVRNADAVVVQNPVQAANCKALTGINPILLGSCYVPPDSACADPKGYVLWAATLRTWKRPEFFVELAKRLPQYRFRMVGGSDGETDYEPLREAAKALPNLGFVGFVPHAEIEAQFNGARLFVNTSIYEGFPNTFLHSWARAIPTVSFVDTGSVVAGAQVVTQISEFDEMVRRVDLMMSNDDVWNDAGRRGLACYQQQHSVAAVLEEHGRIFARVLGSELNSLLANNPT